MSDPARAGHAPAQGDGLSADALKRVIAANVDGMLVLDGEGVILFANPAAESLFGAGEDGLVGVQFGHPLVGETSFELEIGTGAPRTAELRVTELEWNGRPAFLASLRDVTARKRQEAELRAARDQLERSNRELHDAIEERDRSYWQLRKIAEVLPICMDCGDVRPEGKWIDVVEYLKANARFLSHGLCPRCEARRAAADLP